MDKLVDERTVRRVKDVLIGVAARLVPARREGESVGLDVERLNEQTRLSLPEDRVEGAAAEFVLDAAPPVVKGRSGKG
jgi:hypothetical protein